MKELYTMTAREQADLIREKQLSPVEVNTAVFERIHKVNPSINAFCELVEEQAIKDAKLAEKSIMSGEIVGELHGVSISIKDLIFTKGIRTTFGSKLYENFYPDEDDIVVERVRKAGAIIIGKTNVSEFGYHPITGNEIFGYTCNPWDLNLTPGASSGGAAAAIASGMGALAIGSDGGGSIRIPASNCGIYGLKPSFGRIPVYPSCRDPRYPGTNSFESVENIGPITRTVEDSALLLNVMEGHDPRDRFSLPNSHTDYLKAIKNLNIRGLKIAWSPDFGYVSLDAEVRRVTAQAVQIFSEDLGCCVEEVDPDFNNYEEAFAAIVARDTDLQGLCALADEKEELFHPATLELIRREWTVKELTTAAMARQEINIKMWKLMQQYDLLLTPIQAGPPFKRNGAFEINGNPIANMNSYFPFTFPFNLTGHPAASVPAGWTKDGLPIGLQIIGRQHDDELVLRASAAYEEANPWRHRWPNLIG
jgi:aspartyl-tRNA(Asn)/glutamyl-tRNA(Gln) amidotransferase subunit A